MERRVVDARLCLLFTPTACAGEPWSVLAGALRGGVDLVQWRQKQRPWSLADLQRTRELCTSHDVDLIVNDDAEAAVVIDAAGVHVGQDDLPLAAAREIVGGRRWVGVSTHDLAQIAAAETGGADYLGFGPCFPTTTKGYREGLAGTPLLDRVVAQARRPWFAIGGIDARVLPDLRRRGVRRIAVSQAILTAADPERAAAELRAQLA